MHSPAVSDVPNFSTSCVQGPVHVRNSTGMLVGVNDTVTGTTCPDLVFSNTLQIYFSDSAW